MIPCYGTDGSRQQINNKLIQEEYKIWVLVAEANGYVVQFTPYQGAKKGKQVASSTKWGLRESVVLRLIDSLTATIIINNINKINNVNNIRAAVVLNKNRLHKCNITGDKQLKKERHHFEQRISSKKAV